MIATSPLKLAHGVDLNVDQGVPSLACWHAQTASRCVRLWALAGLAFCAGGPIGAKGETLAAAKNESGVRHALSAAVESTANSPLTPKTAQSGRATLAIVVQILDYAPDYRFYGTVRGSFPDFDPAKGAPAQEIWTDGTCHRDRGFPRIWVTAIEGKVTQAGSTFEIAARPRHIGKLLPGDEILVQKDRPELPDAKQSLVLLARTLYSGFTVRLSLNSAKCFVTGE